MAFRLDSPWESLPSGGGKGARRPERIAPCRPSVSSSAMSDGGAQLPQRPPTDNDVEIARIQADAAKVGHKAVQAVERWKALSKIVPAFIATGGTVLTGDAIANGGNGFEPLLIGAMLIEALALSGCGVKIWWDRRQKQRLRRDRTALERENRTLEKEVAELRGELRAIERRNDE